MALLQGTKCFEDPSPGEQNFREAFVRKKFSYPVFPQIIMCSTKFASKQMPIAIAVANSEVNKKVMHHMNHILIVEEMNRLISLQLSGSG